MNKLPSILLLATIGNSAMTCAAADTVRVARVADPAPMKALAAHHPGRSSTSSAGETYQWPGLYFEARFDGPSVFFKVGPGDVILRVKIDGTAVATLEKPAPGVYEIGNLASTQHSIRVEALTESQAGANVFGGFLLPKATRPLPTPPRSRQIEFIGDSHTVGYGNTSKTRDCDSDAVWKTTDSSQAFGAKMAQHYDADFQLNAISGRGVVRNYDGSPGDPLPVAYPYVLLDHARRYEGDRWHPQVIVIALGTNDFSTELKPEEKWKSRDQLRADYEATYRRFLEGLRARNPSAYFVVWATDMAEGEIESEAGKVVAQRQSAGDSRITFVRMDGLAMTGCHWHPSVADDDTIAAALIRVIDAKADAWKTSR